VHVTEISSASSSQRTFIPREKSTPPTPRIANTRTVEAASAPGIANAKATDSTRAWDTIRALVVKGRMRFRMEGPPTPRLSGLLDSQTCAPSAFDRMRVLVGYRIVPQYVPSTRHLCGPQAGFRHIPALSGWNRTNPPSISSGLLAVRCCFEQRFFGMFLRPRPCVTAWSFLSELAVRSPETMQQSVRTPREPSSRSFYIRRRYQPTADLFGEDLGGSVPRRVAAI